MKNLRDGACICRKFFKEKHKPHAKTWGCVAWNGQRDASSLRVIVWRTERTKGRREQGSGPVESIELGDREDVPAERLRGSSDRTRAHHLQCVVEKAFCASRTNRAFRAVFMFPCEVVPQKRDVQLTEREAPRAALQIERHVLPQKLDNEYCCPITNPLMMSGHGSSPGTKVTEKLTSWKRWKGKTRT